MHRLVWPMIVMLGSLSILMAQNEPAPAARASSTGVGPSDSQTGATGSDDDLRCTMHGRITDAITGVALAEVKVKVRGQKVADTTTDETGVYLVKGLPPGRYRIFIEKEGYGGGASADEL